MTFLVPETSVAQWQVISGSSISGLNPDDIEKYHVLEGASATAIYGVKAANSLS